MLEHSYIVESVSPLGTQFIFRLPEKALLLNNQQETPVVLLAIRSKHKQPENSPETARDITPFQFFPALHKCKLSNYDFSGQNSQKQQREKLHWFIGFTEADGCFTYDSMADKLYFIIRQKEPNVLFQIQTILGFGNMTLDGYGYYSYSVKSKKGLLKILSICNGNLLLQKETYCSIC